MSALTVERISSLTMRRAARAFFCTKPALSSNNAIAKVVSGNHWSRAPTVVQAHRRAESKRFGASARTILAGGLVGVGLVAKWLMMHQPDEWRPRPVAEADRLEVTARVNEQHHVEALLSEVRIVLARFGISLGSVPLRVQLFSEHTRGIEGLTTKVLRPPPVLRGVEAISLRRNLTAVTAAQVLAHEYTHAWLWLQGFPELDQRLEEGLCELLSYLFLLSCLRDPPPAGGGVLARDPEALRGQIMAIEANAHPDYGGGFRDCVEALHGRTLHEVLFHVRQHGMLPARASAVDDARGGASSGSTSSMGGASDSAGGESSAAIARSSTEYE